MHACRTAAHHFLIVPENVSAFHRDPRNYPAHETFLNLQSLVDCNATSPVGTEQSSPEPGT